MYPIVFDNIRESFMLLFPVKIGLLLITRSTRCGGKLSTNKQIADVMKSV